MPFFVCEVTDKQGNYSVIEYDFPDAETARTKLLSGLVDIDSGLTLKFIDVRSITEVSDDYLEKKLDIQKDNSSEYNLSNCNLTNKIILTSSFCVSGRSIKQDLGFITSRTVLGINIIDDTLVDLKNIFGGKSGTLETHMSLAEKTVLSGLRTEAERLGADAVINVHISHNLPPRMLMTFVQGTAVMLEPVHDGPINALNA